MKAMKTINYRGYEALAVNKDVFGHLCTSGYIVIPKGNPLYGKIESSLDSEYKLSFTFARNLLTKKVFWAIAFTLEGLSQDKVILECKKIIDQLDEIVNNISQ